MEPSPPVRIAFVTSESLDPARASGTAVSVAAMRAALRTHDVATCVVQPRGEVGSHTVRRHRFNRLLTSTELNRYGAVIGINGDGWMVAPELRVPFLVAIKALYGGALDYEHGPVKQLLRLHARWEAAGTRAAAAVIVPSQFAAEAVIKRYGVDARSIHVVPEPFACERWRMALPTLQRAGRRVLCVAHLYPRKRVVDLLRAWPLVRAAIPDARLDVAGGGPELRRLAHAARALLGCYLHGHVNADGIRQLHARADVFCLPSAQETFGYAAVEAMASGLPLVIADAGSLPEVCAGAVALRFPPGDVQALAGAVIEMLRDGGQRAEAAERNPVRAARYEPGAVGARMLELVLEVQRRAGGSAARCAGSLQ